MTNIDTNSIAYIQGWNSAATASTGGNPFQGRKGEAEWSQGRLDAQIAWGIRK